MTATHSHMQISLFFLISLAEAAAVLKSLEVHSVGDWLVEPQQDLTVT